MIADERHDRFIVLPFGLIQLFRDFSKLNPSSNEFDLFRTLDYAAAPLHYTFGRGADNAGHEFIVDVRAAQLNRDLHRYAGFTPANQPRAEGLAFPRWGRTFTVHKNSRGGFHGIFLGAGPYLSMQSDAVVDRQLIDILGTPGSASIPNTQLRAASDIRGQMALGIIGGYRARFSLPESSSDRDGVYVAANYDFLQGFRYEDVAAALRLDTDSSGLLTLNPLLPSPLLIARDHARSGTGRSIDIDTAVVINRWEFGLGANGLGNRIDWTGVTRTTYALANLLSGNSDFLESVPERRADARVELPIDYRGNVGYDADDWSVVAEVGKGFGGRSFHGGYEYRFRTIEVRAGAMYTRQLWSPSAGIGLNMSAHTALDVGVYSNAANVERKRRPAIAVSLRLKG
jgi:hypothetical protein